MKENLLRYLFILMTCFLNVFSNSFLCNSFLYGEALESYFKKCPHKEGDHSIRNIDFIYVINLDRRPEKYAGVLKEFAPYGINPYRFSAVNGWEIPLDKLMDLGVTYKKGMTPGIMGTYYDVANGGMPTHEMIAQIDKNYFSHCLSRGAVGIVLSHLSILQDAYDAGYETIWVMEDDIQVIRNPHLLSDLIVELDQTVGKKRWDILFTDRDTKNQKGEYVPCTAYAKRPNFQPSRPERFAHTKQVGSFRKIGARYGAYSMIVRRSGMKKILDFLKTYKVFLPYDMEFYLMNNIRLYTVKDDIVSTFINALSDNGAPNYNKSEKK